MEKVSSKLVLLYRNNSNRKSSFSGNEDQMVQNTYHIEMYLKYKSSFNRNVNHIENLFAFCENHCGPEY